MPRPTMFLVPAILIMPLASTLATAQTSVAQPAANECKTKPDSPAPPGSHWYYRVNRTDQRQCWYLGAEGRKVRSQAREGASPIARENAPEMSRTMPPQMEPAQRTAAEAASAEQPAGAGFVSTFGPPKAPDLDALQPTTASNGDTQDRARTDAQQEMPLIWPVLTEAERAALPDTESAPWSAFVIAALALLFAGAIFKLARRHARSYRRDRWRMARPRLRQRRRPYAARMAARPNQGARRSAVRTQRDDAMWQQRPTAIDPTEATSLRKLMHELQRTTA
jgi:hypothetical protein